ncbi:MAG: hypothetical protein JO011_11810 [Ktedonobacteraceae bacterium]|nr:hypothetical protein [Ktedonobacteraceae bacterium]
MNFGSLMIRTLVALVVLFLLYLAGALTFPALSASANGTRIGLTGLLVFLLAIVLLSVVGSLLARGIRSVKRSGEALLMGFIGSLFMGGILVIFAQLNVPYTVRVNPSWTGTSWYSSFLSLLFIGIPLMFVFLIGE